MICVAEKDLPDLYQEADGESKAAQHTYLQVFGGILGATVLGAAATWYSIDFEPNKVVVSALSVLLMLIAFALTYVLSDRHYDQTWYMGRAIAESVKTRSWSYMMRSEPYLGALPTAEVNRRFVEDLRKILKERGHLTLTKSLTPSNGQISDVMRNVRALGTLDRLEVYMRCRVLDQKQWYGRKATESSAKERRTFLLMQLSQLVAIVIGFVFLYIHRVTSGSVGVLAALSACILAWLWSARSFVPVRLLV